LIEWGAYPICAGIHIDDSYFTNTVAFFWGLLTVGNRPQADIILGFIVEIIAI
jgi:hypothetical protein